MWLASKGLKKEIFAERKFCGFRSFTKIRKIKFPQKFPKSSIREI